jgi:CheY-like chemotaxis protein
MKKIDRILLIDDDEINNFINELLLRGLDLTDQFHVFKNGKEALAFIKESCIVDEKLCSGLIILDHYMPVMDGMEFMEELNKINHTNSHEFVVLLLAATTSPADLKKFEALGIADTTDKPLSEEKVLEVCELYHKRRKESKN